MQEFSAGSVQLSSVQSLSRVWFCDPMNHSMPGLPVHHQLLEFTQTHVHRVSDAIQPSYPLLSPSSTPQSLPASGSFPMSQLFKWGGQSIGVSASASVLPMNTQDWSPLGWTCWISLKSKGLSRVFSNTTVQKNQFFGAQLSSQSNSHIHTWPLEKPYLDYRRTFVGKVMSLLFNMLSRLVITFLPRSKHLLISWLAIIICSDFGAPKNKVWYCSPCFSIYLPWRDGTRYHELGFLNVEL